MTSDVILSRKDIKIGDYKYWKGDGIAIWWLGQAGFLIRYKEINLIIDAYLSNVLAEKYKGKEFPHIRMMESPLGMNELTEIDFYICSHAHSDHMDPGLIPIVRDNCPDCHFIVPKAVMSMALERGAPEDRLTGIDAGETLSLASWIKLSAVPAAHEEIKQDERNNHFFLGYILDFDELIVYHPGDCLPYEDHDAWLEKYSIDLALMPVNGREEKLSSKGIAGNFNFDQAFEILQKHDIHYMIPHHYGMFDFNTVEPDFLNQSIKEKKSELFIFPAEIGIEYNLVRK